jgi:recombinational DNA repair protein (RecF pathway)
MKREEIVAAYKRFRGVSLAFVENEPVAFAEYLIDREGWEPPEPPTTRRCVDCGQRLGAVAFERNGEGPLCLKCEGDRVHDARKGKTT